MNVEVGTNTIEAAAKAQVDDVIRRNTRQRPNPRWMTVANGRVYRPVMRLMHRLGWCYPERTFVDERSVWCHWCGMRGCR